MKKLTQILPGYLMILMANAIPVYGAAIGKLVFFQVIYLFWMESLLLIFLDSVKIAAAKGDRQDSSGFNALADQFSSHKENEKWNFFKRSGLILKSGFIRVFILLFYLVFIVAFIGFQVTDNTHSKDVWMTMAFRNSYFNASLLIFFVNGIVQLIGGFFFTGNYRLDSPRRFASPFDGRTILMHVMIVGSVFIHQFLFAGKSYAALGEVVYIGLFMLVRTAGDIFHFRQRIADGGDAILI